MKVLLVMVCHSIHMASMESLASVWQIEKGPHILDLMLLTESPYWGEGDKNIGYNLERSRSFSLQNGYDYLLIVESDITVPRDALLKLLEVQADVTVGLTPERPTKVSTDRFIVEMPWNQNRDSRALIEKGRPFEMTGRDGYTCVLVSRMVLEVISFPVVPSGDMNWYDRLHTAGFKVVCHPGVLCGHKDRDGRVIRDRTYILNYWTSQTDRGQAQKGCWYYYIPGSWWYGMTREQFLKALPEHLDQELMWWTY